MKRGTKPQLPSTKIERGTFQPVRDANRVEIITPDSLPQQPDWLTESGREVWLDDIGRVAQARMATEIDSTAFGNYCNLQGAIAATWRVGEVPPAAHLMEGRRMAEQFGLFGAKSRIGTISSGTNVPTNPFDKFKRT